MLRPSSCLLHRLPLLWMSSARQTPCTMLLQILQRYSRVSNLSDRSLNVGVQGETRNLTPKIAYYIGAGLAKLLADRFKKSANKLKVSVSFSIIGMCSLKACPDSAAAQHAALSHCLLLSLMYWCLHLQLVTLISCEFPSFKLKK